MSKPLVDRIPFVKILIVLAVVFGISLGLCGLTGLSVMQGGGMLAGLQRILGQTAIWDMLGMVFSAAGIGVTLIAWVVLTVVSRLSSKE